MTAGPTRRAALLVVTLTTALLLGAATVCPVWADGVVLVNGDFVSGEVETGDFEVVTPEGPVRIEPSALAEVALGTVVGDVVELRTGRKVTGLVARPAYSIRLESGQTIVFARQLVSQIRFHRR